MLIMKTLVLTGFLSLALVSTVSSSNLAVLNKTTMSAATSNYQSNLNVTLENSTSFEVETEKINNPTSLESIKAPEVITEDSGFLLRSLNKKQKNTLIIVSAVVVCFVIVWCAWCYLSDRILG